MVHTPAFTRGALLVLCALIVQLAGASNVRGAPLGTAFTYQGQLKQNGVAVNATCDFQFTAHDASSGGSQVGSVQTVAGVAVVNGLFSAYPIDFGTSGLANSIWIEVSATCPSGIGSPSVFPRQLLTPAPSAVYAGLAGSTTAFSGSLVGDVTGTQGATVISTVGGASAANVASATTRANGATSANTASALVARDVNGGFSAGPITANVVRSTSGQAFELQVYDERAWRLEPTTGCGSATCAPNVVGGFSTNSVSTGVAGAVIAGGGSTADGANRVTSHYGAVLGGANNVAGGAPSSPAENSHAVVLGGKGNTAAGQASIAGGQASTASGNYSVALGYGNSALAQYSVALGSATASGPSAVAIGSNAQASDDSAVALGSSSSASGQGATAIGPNTSTGAFALAMGLFSRASGNYSVALGLRANTNGKQGAVVISDASQFLSPDCGASDDTVCAQNPNEIRLRGSGGIRLRTSLAASSTPGSNSNTGCDLPAGSGTWTCSSSRELKTDFGSIDTRAILESLAALPIQSWRFKGEAETLRHVGPVAEDFAAAFPLGHDNRSIPMSDEQGVALAAIQGLYQIVREQGAAILRLQSERLDKDAVIAAQAAKIADLEGHVAALRELQDRQQQDIATRLAALEEKLSR